MRIRQALPVVTFIVAALLGSSLPAVAANRAVTLHGSIDFGDTIPDAVTTVTAYSAPSAWVSPSSLAAVGSVKLEQTGGSGVASYDVTVPEGSRVYLDFSTPSSLQLANDWWLGADGVVAGAYPLVDPLVVGTNVTGGAPVQQLGLVSAVHLGAISFPFAEQKAAGETAPLNCVHRVDETRVNCVRGAGLVSQLYPGTYRVRSSSSTLAKTVRVPSGQTAVVDFSSGASISGRVVDSRGKGVPGLTVSTDYLDGPSTVTDGSGGYLLTALAPGAVSLSVFNAATELEQAHRRRTIGGVGGHR